MSQTGRGGELAAAAAVGMRAIKLIIGVTGGANLREEDACHGEAVKLGW